MEDVLGVSGKAKGNACQIAGQHRDRSSAMTEMTMQMMDATRFHDLLRNISSS